MLRGSGLVETVKWAKLRDGHAGANVALIFGLREYCGVEFLTGALLDDPHCDLHRMGENSPAMRILRFASLAQIDAGRARLIALIERAIAAKKPETGNARIDECAPQIRAGRE